MKRIIVLILAISMLFLLAGCECQHKWESATCVSAKICSKCGETQGDPNGHKWSPATCDTPKICEICGQTQGNELDHVWRNATCEESSKCDNCGKTQGEPAGHSWQFVSCDSAMTCSECAQVQAEIVGHKWKAADCETPKSCEVCELKEGEALGHSWVDATCEKAAYCTVCSKTDGEKLEHHYQPATCTQASTCALCEITQGEPTGHSVQSWVVSREATCTVCGVESGVCETCGDTVEQETNVVAHEPGEWEVIVMPSEGQNGVRIKKCTMCGEEQERESFSMTEEEIKAEYIEKCKTIAYKDLERKPGEYEGEYVKFTGYVVQVCSEASSALYYSTYRVATSGYYDDVVYIYVDNYGSDTRILEDDKITFYGVYDGLYTYTTVRGNSISIPCVKVAYYE